VTARNQRQAAVVQSTVTDILREVFDEDHGAQDHTSIHHSMDGAMIRQLRSTKSRRLQICSRLAAALEQVPHSGCNGLFVEGLASPLMDVTSVLQEIIDLAHYSLTHSLSIRIGIPFANAAGTDFVTQYLLGLGLSRDEIFSCTLNATDNRPVVFLRVDAHRLARLGASCEEPEKNAQPKELVSDSSNIPTKRSNA